MKRVTYRFSGVGEDFGPRSDGLVTAHTTESPFGALLVSDALGLARWQDADAVLGSYNDLICIDGIVSTVPPAHASGGINPGSAYFKPESWLYDVMPREQVHNPNFFTRNICFMGERWWFDAHGWPPEMIDNFVTVQLEEEARIVSRTILTDHEDFQTNRTDAGPIANALIRKRYAERTSEVPMPLLRPVRQRWTTGTGNELAADSFAAPGGQFWTAGPGVGGPEAFHTARVLWSIAETEDGLWRLLEFEDRTIWMHRYNLRPIEGTRNPATGFGSPVLGSVVGYTEDQLKERLRQATTPLLNRINEIKAKVAVTAADVSND